MVLALGLAYAGFSIVSDVNSVGEHNIATGALVLLGLALLVALGFEFVNGLHDAANVARTSRANAAWVDRSTMTAVP